MTRIRVLGGSGAGKSTVARQIGERLGLPVVHLDRLYWRPNWTEAPEDEFRAACAAAVAEERWVIDGNYTRVWEGRPPRADLIVVLDLGWPRRLWRVLRRVGKERPDMPEGCVERYWSRGFLAHLRWTVWHWPRVQRPRFRREFASPPEGVKIVWLSSPAQIERFLSDLDTLNLG